MFIGTPCINHTVNKDKSIIPRYNYKLKYFRNYSVWVPGISYWKHLSPQITILYHHKLQSVQAWPDRPDSILGGLKKLLIAYYYWGNKFRSILTSKVAFIGRLYILVLTQWNYFFKSHTFLLKTASLSRSPKLKMLKSFAFIIDTIALSFFLKC